METKTTKTKEVKMINFVKKNTVDILCNQIKESIKQQFINKNISEAELKKVLELIKDTERLKSVLPLL